ncbi:ATP-binding protein [Streptomyces sp. RB6PN25]|uniref:ATP-binding protein n=1 Tax=Streptomyces humicola TaxID=2953240 RepID=A0ABT1Q0Z1_9ACTN|nr:ATP-binding protein [Streptomyces humicola]MCQ4083610.1 ATP-binding protein [Streptomyces humicola]
MITHHHTRQCSLELEALPHRIGQVRRIVSAKLRYWDLHPLIDATLLGITELLANVHQHAQPDKRCSVEMVFSSGRLTVSVTDNDPRPPRLGSPIEPLATSGRGLAMVAAVSESWGTRPSSANGSGKAVWFTLSAPVVPPAAAPAEAAVPAALTIKRRRTRPQAIAVSLA